MNCESQQRDRGSILPMVLVIVTVLGAVVAAVSTYVTTDLRYGQVVEDRAVRLAAADGGMRFAVEHVDAGLGQLCIVGGGTNFAPPIMNQSAVDVSCGQAGTPIHNTNGWALILTGEGIPADKGDSSCLETFFVYDPVTNTTVSETQNVCALLKTVAGTSNDKVIGGPVYMADLRFETNASLKFDEGYLMHGGDCSVTPTFNSNISFDPSSLGHTCNSHPWSRQHNSVSWSADADPVNGLFSEPNRASDSQLAALPVNPAYTDVTTNGPCRVFQPGRYNSSYGTPAGSFPLANGGNYFMSGIYLFDGVTVDVKQAQVTAGRSSGLSGDAQVLPNPDCDYARSLDANTSVLDAGVTFYLRNDSSFAISPGGSLEVLRRKQGSNYVSIHYLDGSRDWSEAVIDQRPGTNKDMAIHGMVWAPHARIKFGLVTNQADGQLLGGAVVSNIDMRSSAVGNGFHIRVAPSDLHVKLQLESVAEKNGNTTTIRSIVDYRPSTTYTAVTSWRVVE